MADKLRPLIDDLMNSTPLIAAARGIAKVGEKTQELYERGKKLVTPSPTPPPRKKKKDILLPRDVTSHSVYRRK